MLAFSALLGIAASSRGEDLQENIDVWTLLLQHSAPIRLISPPLIIEGESSKLMPAPPIVSIIIDDLGYAFTPAEQLLAMPYDLTLAIIPFTPYGARIANLANLNQREVMLHAPMETLGARKWEDGLTSDMIEESFTQRLLEMLLDIPHVAGINNHGGSRLTQETDKMDWTMTVLAQKQLYFVDSRTTAASVTLGAALKADVRFSKRDIFLDNDKSLTAILSQIDKLRAIAHETGSAIAIGHPYPTTLQALSITLPLLERDGIKVVKVSHLMRQASQFPPILMTQSNLEK
ncbi:MAG: polysaccharide deacetylase 2 family uncharacterized protein YibQ [Lentisphaeria bacterium]